MKSVEELDLVRKNTLKEMKAGGDNAAHMVMVGMATCGMAAGAGKVMNAIEEELKLRNVSNVSISKTGCIGV